MTSLLITRGSDNQPRPARSSSSAPHPTEFKQSLDKNGLTAGGNGTAGVKGTGVNGTAGVNSAPDSLGGQRGGDHEDRGDSTDDRKPDEHLSLSLGRLPRTRQSAPLLAVRAWQRDELATPHGLSPKAKHPRVKYRAS